MITDAMDNIGKKKKRPEDFENNPTYEGEDQEYAEDVSRYIKARDRRNRTRLVEVE